MPQKRDLHPTFAKKRVLELECRYCLSFLCGRGMRAILLADTNIELYSTDLPPGDTIELVGSTYTTENCDCKIKDIACITCGNTVGYHVILPCRSCLQSCNNGHFWMFHSSSSAATERVDGTGAQVLTWGDLCDTEDDVGMQFPFEECDR
ncbi:protein FAM72A-like [Branchiostoma floridae]|uniref:Protein FAM72A-like n=2 Tax=Branchiostoma TaxID=7737 RepID=C3Z2W2_BRAFL|nr:PREDICTED: protein FAM72A-like [Branchiostoma belcheri]XP_035677768.1 protein FAM72A-like [Branchiostoma floridae]KAI8491217.1 Protein fam72a [Branchiostoma belcheri]KAI8508234.1 Protein fam72a [Branchiostoma belcheri]|eukprot:XP_002597351.1 hypothetical protein BRAFLDRAFT_276331 [Branchiostoma floridae]